MIEVELEKYVPYKAMVLEQVLVWTLLDIAQFHFKDSDSYLAKLKSIFVNAKKDGNGFNKAGNYALREFERWFHIDSWLIDFICGRPCINGKKVRVANLIMSQLEQQSRMIHHVGKKNVTYTSGKTFSHLSFWFIDTRWVKGMFNNSKYIDHKNSDWYCEEAKYIISKIAYPYSRMKAKHLKKTFDKLKKIAEDKNMTKEEKAKLKEECEKGMHAFPYKELVKHIEKREKTKLRTMQTRIRKMTQKAMAEIVIENEKLKNENSTLKQHVEELEQECAATIEKLDEANEKVQRLGTYARELKTKNEALEKKLDGISTCSQKDEVQDDVPKAPDKVIDNAMLERAICKRTISSSYAKKLADVLRLPAHEFTPTPFWGWPDTCRSIHDMKDMLQSVIDHEKWYVPDSTKLKKLKNEVQSFESRILEEKKTNEETAKRREAEAKAEKTAKMQNAQVVAEAYARGALKEAKAKAEMQSLKTPPPIAVPKPQPPAVTDENADAVLEELGL